MRATTKDAYLLLHEGAQVLSQIEANGIRVDTKFLSRTIDKLTAKIEKKTKQLKEDKVWRKHWRKAFGDNAKLGNRQQLAHVLYDRIGYDCTKRTKPSKKYPHGQPSADQEALEAIDLPFVKLYFEVAGLAKAKGTWLLNLQKETVDEYLHPSFHLHTARTMRSSSGSDKESDNWSGGEINFQNLPVRDPVKAGLVRSCFIPSPNNRLFFKDYSGIEVKIAYCYNHDPIFREDVLHGDMHRDTAALCYMIEQEQVAYNPRYAAKNQMVFPQFYGSYYIDCCKAMWKSMDRLPGMRIKKSGDDKKEPTGRLLKEHLAKKGIRERGACEYDESPVRGTFEYHLRQVEKKFWERYKKYAKWKKWAWNDYLEKGYCDMFTGFRIEGPHKKNDVINYRIQGAAFHCMLKALILIQKDIRKYKMKSKIVGQIHDQVVGDVPDKETQAFHEITEDAMTRKVPKLWPWITIPLSAEAEVTPIDGSWFTAKELAI